MNSVFIYDCRESHTLTFDILTESNLVIEIDSETEKFRVVKNRYLDCDCWEMRDMCFLGSFVSRFLDERYTELMIKKTAEREEQGNVHSCRYCSHFFEHDSVFVAGGHSDGVCKRYPPNKFGIDGYPKVKFTDVCGEWSEG